MSWTIKEKNQLLLEYFGWGFNCDTQIWTGPDGKRTDELPNAFESLDELRPLEFKLMKEDPFHCWMDYVSLMDLAVGVNDHGLLSRGKVLLADAPQRAEMLGRALRIWT